MAVEKYQIIVMKSIVKNGTDHTLSAENACPGGAAAEVYDDCVFEECRVFRNWPWVHIRRVEVLCCVSVQC